MSERLTVRYMLRVISKSCPDQHLAEPAQKARIQTCLDPCIIQGPIISLFCQ